MPISAATLFKEHHMLQSEDMTINYPNHHHIHFMCFLRFVCKIIVSAVYYCYS